MNTNINTNALATLSSSDAPTSPAAANLAVAPVKPFFSAKRKADIARVKAWLCSRENVGSAAHVLYNLLRELPPSRGFTAPLRQGASTWLAFQQAAASIPAVAKNLDVELTPEMTAQLADAVRLSHTDDFVRSCAAGEPSVTSALWKAMRATPHGSRSDVLEHGRDALKAYRQLAAGRFGDASMGETPPEWLSTHGAALLLRQVPLWHMSEYLINHDCGKPFVAVRDNQGRLHFPGHAEKSAQVWALAGKDAVQVELMRLDMALHTLAVADMAEFSKNPLAPSLLLASYAQIHANAELFGGRFSDSFKIKLKALGRRANALCEIWFGSSAAPQN